MDAPRDVVLAVLLVVGLALGGVACSGGAEEDPDGAGGSSADADDAAAADVPLDIPNDVAPDSLGGTDPLADAADPDADDATLPYVDPVLVGVWSFAFSVAMDRQYWPEWGPFPVPTNPRQEVRVGAAMVIRPDGTASQIFKIIWRDDSEDSEPEIYPEVDGPSELVVRVEDDVLIIDEGEEELEWLYDYDEETELLSLGATGNDLHRPDQVIWRREAVDPELVGSWRLESWEDDAGLVLTPENQSVTMPEMAPTPVEARVTGSLALDEDGTYLREFALWVDDEAVRTERFEGIWYVRDGILAYEEAGVDAISWTYTVDLESNRFTQTPGESWDPDVREIVWERVEAE